MSGREPVRPHGTGKERDAKRREMCEVDEEDEEDAFEKWMRPFNPDVEEKNEKGVGVRDRDSSGIRKLRLRDKRRI